jgi:hypothetical protein
MSEPAKKDFSKKRKRAKGKPIATSRGNRSFPKGIKKPSVKLRRHRETASDLEVCVDLFIVNIDKLFIIIFSIRY